MIGLLENIFTTQLPNFKELDNEHLNNYKYTYIYATCTHIDTKEINVHCKVYAH